MELFEAKVRYVKIDESGKEKKVTENFILDSVSFTDAETTVTKELDQYITGDFVISSLKRSNINEISTDFDGTEFFKVKVAFIEIDELTGKEKKAKIYFLVLAEDIDGANKNTYAHFADSITDYKIESVSESRIIDYFKADVF